MPPARLHIPGAHADVLPLPSHQYHSRADADPGERPTDLPPGNGGIGNSYPHPGATFTLEVPLLSPTPSFLGDPPSYSEDLFQ